MFVIVILSQDIVPPILQTEAFKACADLFGFICDGKDLTLMTLVPAAHFTCKHVRELVKKRNEKH